MPVTREVTAWYDISGRYYNIRSEYRQGTRETFVQEAASLVSFSDPRVRPAGRRHESEGPPAGSCRFESGDSASQIRGFDPRVRLKQSTVHGDLIREWTVFSWVMTRPDPQDFETC